MSRAQDDLFSSAADWQTLELPDASLRLLPAAFSAARAEQLFEALRSEIPWQQASLRMAGRNVPIPRLQCWMGDAGTLYGYSGLRLEPRPWSPLVAGIHRVIEALSGEVFNSVLLNLYRDGNDSVAWHADNEPELGPQPVIASLSLGAERPFQLKHRDRPELRKSLHLPPGSLLVMTGDTQANWLHQLPKRRRLSEARINLTFRRILPDADPASPPQ